MVNLKHYFTNRDVRHIPFVNNISMMMMMMMINKTRVEYEERFIIIFFRSTDSGTFNRKRPHRIRPSCRRDGKAIGKLENAYLTVLQFNPRVLDDIKSTFLISL